MKSYRLYTFNLSYFIVISSFLISCGSKENQDDSRDGYVISDSLFKTLKIDTVKVSNIKNALKFNGIVGFNEDEVENIYPLVSGSVQGVTKGLGDYVKTGEALGIVKSSEMANYSSSLIDAQAGLLLANKQLQQQQDLYKSGLASQVDLTAAQANYQQAKAALTAAKRILAINGNSTDGVFTIKAPISGFVVQKNITNGMNIRADNNAPMFVVSDLKNVWVQANVYEENIDKIHKGDDADITTITYPGKVFKGKINEMNNVLDPVTKVMKIRIVLDNPDFLLKPEMFTTVTVYNTEQQQAMTIKSDALIFDQSQYFVVAVSGKKELHIHKVEVLTTNGEETYIKSGISPGERLVASKAILIYGSLNN